MIMFNFIRAQLYSPRLQNSPYFCVFKCARAVKQKIWNEGENRERDWGETRKTLTPRFTDFFSDFEEKKTTVLQSIIPSVSSVCFHKYVL